MGWLPTSPTDRYCLRHVALVHDTRRAMTEVLMVEGIVEGDFYTSLHKKLARPSITTSLQCPTAEQGPDPCLRLWAGGRSKCWSN